MADHPRAGGMGNFAKRHSEHHRPQTPDDKAALQDLKLPVPKGTKPRRVKSESSSRRPRTRAHSTQEQQLNQQPRTLVGTDPDSFDDSTITRDMKRNAQANSHQQRHQGSPQDQNYQFKGEDYDGFEGGSGDLAESDGAQRETLNGQGRTRSYPEQNPRPRSSHNTVQGHNLPHIRGDSYPNTTSGNPSTADLDDMVEGRLANQQPQGLPARGGPGGKATGSRLSNVPHPGTSQQYRQQHERGPIQAAPLHGGQVDVLAATRSAFTFQPGPQIYRPPQPPGMRPNAAQPPQDDPKVQLKPPEVVSAQQATQKSMRDPQAAHHSQPRGHYKSREDTREYVTPEPSAHPPPIQAVDVRPRTAAGIRQEKAALTQEPEQHQPADSDPAQSDLDEDQQPEDLVSEGQGFNDQEASIEEVEEAYRQREAEEAYRRGEAEEEPSPKPEIKNDFDDEELFSKKYEELRDLPFDKDPRAEELQWPSFEESASLPQKLEAATSLVATTEEESERYAIIQADFISSLTMDQWEEAGDWFLGRFGDIANRFKTARQNKRKLTKEFEEEVSKRHEVVTKKQKLTQNALNEMKESGGKVLQASPNKTRQSK